MDDQDSPSTIGKKIADSERLSLVWDKFYAHCSTIIHECPSVRRLSIVDREDCVQEVMVEIVRRFRERQPDSGQEKLTKLDSRHLAEQGRRHRPSSLPKTRSVL